MFVRNSRRRFVQFLPLHIVHERECGLAPLRPLGFVVSRDTYLPVTSRLRPRRRRTPIPLAVLVLVLVLS